MKLNKTDRRKNPDAKVRVLFWLSVLAWTCFIVALVVYHYGRPELDYGVFRYKGITVRGNWMPGLRSWFEGLLAVCIGLSVISLLVNKKVMRRRHDRWRYNVVLLLLICFASLVGLFVP